MRCKFSQEWPLKHLHEVAEIRTGVALGNNNHRDPVELPYLRVANVQDGFLDLREIKRVRISREKVERFKLQSGDVLVTEGGDFDKLGRGYVWDGAIDPCLHQNHIFAIRLQKDVVDPHFLAILMGSSYGRLYFLGCAKKSTNLASINSSELKRMLIPVPGIEEQREICGRIRIWETAERDLERLIEAKVTLRTGLMQKLLGPAVSPENDWCPYRLKELFRERTETGRTDLPLLSITGDRGVILRDEIERRDSSSEDKNAYKRIAPGDIGYNTMRMWQGVSALADVEGIVSPAYTVCIPNELIDGLFAAHLFKFPPIVHLFHRFSQGLVDDTLNLKFGNFGEVTLRIPTVEKQRHIASILTTAGLEIGLLMKFLGKVRNQKRAITERLLDAEIGTTANHQSRNGCARRAP